MSSEDLDQDTIITDVDRLMHAISRAKKIDLGQLQRETGISRKAIDTWVKVLEDQGYIKLEYGIASSYATWIGEPAEEFEQEGEEKHKEIIQEIEHEVEGNPDFAKQFEESGLEAEGLSLPEKEEKPEEARRNVKDSILESMNESPSGRDILHELELEEQAMKKAEEIAKADEVKEQEEEPDTLGHEANEQFTAYREMHKENQEQESEETEETLEETEKPIEITGFEKAGKREKTIKNVVSDYLDEINRQRTVIEALKREKEYVHRKKYLSLESKIESDMATITERVLEKEGRIIELRERALELPGKVEDLAKFQQSIGKIQDEGKGILVKTKDKVNAFVADMKKAKETINSKIARNRELVNTGKARVEQLQDASSALEGSIEKMASKAGELKAQLEDTTSRLHEMYEELENVTGMKAQIAEVMSNVEGTIETKEEELDALGESLDELEKIESWIGEYVNDYENKLGEIEQYVTQGEEELHRLREASESEYIKKYLKELETLTLTYEREIENVAEEEKDIDMKIEDAKKHLETLVGESKSMLKKFRNAETAGTKDEQFETLIAKAKAKAERAKDTTVEKARERGRLRDDVRTAKDKRKSKREEVKTRAKEKRKKGKRK